LNLSEATGANADTFVTFDKNTIGKTFGGSGSVTIPNSGGESIMVEILQESHKAK
jgi:hypothetical protein